MNDLSKIEQIINQLPARERELYPEHILDPIRVEIARQLVYKELLKLVPPQDETGAKYLYDKVLSWVDGREAELAPVHDFWNYCDGTMTSLKLKDIVPLLTSRNISWQREDIESASITLYWPVGTLADYKQESYSYDFVSSMVLSDSDVLRKNLIVSDEKSAQTIVSRDDFPIIILRLLDGNLKLLDGNRRVFRKWLHGDKTISAWVGSVTSEPILKDDWVNTGNLRKLLSQYTLDRRPEIFAATRAELELLFDRSEIAQTNYRLRCLDKQFGHELAEGLL